MAAALLFVPLSSARAQAPINPTGHWAGAIETPTGAKMPFELDVTKNKEGKLGATYTSPTEKVEAMPLLGVVVSAKTVTFQSRRSATLKGDMSDDGKLIAGNYSETTPDGTAITLPFKLTRDGVARVSPSPTNPPVSTQLAGTWDGLLEVNGFKVAIRLKLTNQRNRTSVGTLTNVTRGEADLPLSEVAMKGSTVTFLVKSVGATYSGTMNAAGTELSGSLTQENMPRPLVFHRPTPSAGTQ